MTAYTTSSLRPVDDYVYLIGRPPLQDFFSFMKTHTRNGYLVDEKELAREWVVAAQRIRELEETERGLADQPPLRNLSAPLTELANRATEDAIVSRALRIYNYSWAIVELDRLMVFQKHINLSIVTGIEASLGSTAPSDHDALQLAMGRLHRAPPVEVVQQAEGSYSFSSTSADLRFLDMTLLDPTMLKDYVPAGYAAAMVGIFVGTSINFMQAYRLKNRLVLTNGSHRAYALRRLGVTHAPFLITDMSEHHGLEMAGLPEVQRNLDLYQNNPRPPLLKDYFNPDLSKVIPVPQTRRVLHLQLATQRWRAPVV